MKKTIALLSFALLSSAAGACLADVHVYVNCDARDAKCLPPPKPPRPPLPPAPPAPPAPPVPGVDMDASPADVAIPVPPTPPAPPSPASIPAPPPPPKVPAVPDSAHADCASKKPGTHMMFTLRPGESMSGVCVKRDGKMRFSLREYRLTE